MCRRSCRIGMILCALELMLVWLATPAGNLDAKVAFTAVILLAVIMFLIGLYDHRKSKFQKTPQHHISVKPMMSAKDWHNLEGFYRHESGKHTVLIRRKEDIK